MPPVLIFQSEDLDKLEEVYTNILDMAPVCNMNILRFIKIMSQKLQKSIIIKN